MEKFVESIAIGFQKIISKIIFFQKYKKLFLCFIAPLFLTGCGAVLLNPKGVVASDQKDLLILSIGLMLIVVIPVIFMTFFFAWKYNDKRKFEKYSPNWAHNTKLEIVCWFVPCVIIIILAYLVWTSSHSLDPYKPITKVPNNIGVYSLHEGKKISHAKPIVIEVVALDWKWLFIYPEYNIATINFIQFPVDTPLAFKITADAPMNSFVIPALGGQIYAMEGMQTKIHYLATEEGVFRGRSTNYSGKGFSGMKFLARSSSEKDFKRWINKVKQEGNFLSLEEYNLLTKKSTNNRVQYFSSVKSGLFDSIIMKFMKPSEGNYHYSHSEMRH